MAKSRPAPPANTDAKLQSASWWLDQAAQFCTAIEDTKARSDAHYELAYECGHAGELESAEVAAKEVAPSTKAIYALTFVAKKYHEAGNADAAAALMQQSAKNRAAAGTKGGELWKFPFDPRVYRAANGAGARVYIDSISDPVQKTLASRDILAARAKADLINLEEAQLSQDEWSEVAYAYASEAHVSETLAAANRLIDPKQRDRAFIALVKALVERKRWEEAANCRAHHFHGVEGRRRTGRF